MQRAHLDDPDEPHGFTEGKPEVRRHIMEFADQYATPEISKQVMTISERAVHVQNEFLRCNGSTSKVCPGFQTLRDDAPQLVQFARMMAFEQYIAMLAFYDPLGDWARYSNILKGHQPDAGLIKYSSDQLIGRSLRFRANQESQATFDNLEAGACSFIVAAAGSGFNVETGLRAFFDHYDGKKKVDIYPIDNSVRALKHFAHRFDDLAASGVKIHPILRDLLHPALIDRDHLTAPLRRTIMTHEFPRLDFSEVPRHVDVSTLYGFGMYIPRYNFTFPPVDPSKKRSLLAGKIHMMGLTGVLASLWNHSDQVTFDLIAPPVIGPDGDAARLQCALIPILLGGRSLNQTPEEDAIAMIEEACPSAGLIDKFSASGLMFDIYTKRRLNT